MDSTKENDNVKKIVVKDDNTDVSMVCVRFTNSVDVYLVAQDEKVNRYMEDHFVAQSYDYDRFEELFPVQAKELFDDVQD